MAALLIVALFAAIGIALIAWDVRNVSLDPDEPQAFR